MRQGLTLHERQVNLLVKERDALRARVAELERERDEANEFIRIVCDLYSEGGYYDIDGGEFQEQAERFGYWVKVPVGTHAECENCEDGAYECGEMRPPRLSPAPAPPPRLPQPERGEE